MHHRNSSDAVRGRVDHLVAGGHQISWSITVTNHAKVRATINRIPDDAWFVIDYSLGGRARVGETAYLEVCVLVSA